MDKTVEYYNINAREFYESTVDANMEEQYRVFLRWIPEGGSILDAGCGSGRDSLYFLRHGYRVTAVDASAALAEMSSKLLGQPVAVMRFQELEFEEAFDGIWACASLLHVPRREMDEVLERMIRGLKRDGVLYASFKYGDGEGERNGRFFNNYDEKTFGELLERHPALELVSTGMSGDVRAGREGEMWLSVVVRRVG